MLSSFKSSNRIIFVTHNDTKTLFFEKKEKVDIILSPAFYWVKKMPLPVKSVREVKKLLPSIFEETLPLATYSYTAYKRKDTFILFAYEDKKILDFLTAKGINSSNISGIYFAQSEFEDSEEAYTVSETQSIISKDALVILIPSLWISKKQPLHLEEKILSKHKILLQQFGHIVDRKSLYTIVGILGILAIILMVEIFIASSKRDAILTSKDALFSKYKLQPTMFQNRSIYTKYSAIHQRQTHLREYISYFLNMQLKSTQRIKIIEVKSKVLIVILSGVTKGNERGLLTQLDVKKLHYKTSFNDKTIKIEIKL